MNNRCVAGIAVDGFGKNILDSIAVRNEVNTIIEAKPKVFIPVYKQAQYIVILNAFAFCKALYKIPLSVNNNTTTYIGVQCNFIGRQQTGAENVFSGNVFNIGACKSCYGILFQNK